MMMCIGQFTFGLKTLAYQEFQRQTEWKHASTSRVGERDAHQFTGKGDDSITLSGWAPAFAGSVDSMDALRKQADEGEAWVLVEGTGRIYGEFVITHLTEGKTLFFADGTPRRIEFSLSLKRVDTGMNINESPGYGGILPDDLFSLDNLDLTE